MVEAQHGRHRRRCDLDLFVAALAQQIEEENAALERIDHVFRPSRQHVSGRRLALARNGLQSRATGFDAVAAIEIDLSAIFMGFSFCDRSMGGASSR